MTTATTVSTTKTPAVACSHAGTPTKNAGRAAIAEMIRAAAATRKALRRWVRHAITAATIVITPRTVPSMRASNGGACRPSDVVAVGQRKPVASNRPSRNARTRPALLSLDSGAAGAVVTVRSMGTPYPVGTRGSGAGVSSLPPDHSLVDRWTRPRRREGFPRYPGTCSWSYRPCGHHHGTMAAPDRPITVVLVDDHPVVRGGLRALIESFTG